MSEDDKQSKPKPNTARGVYGVAAETRQQKLNKALGDNLQRRPASEQVPKPKSQRSESQRKREHYD